MEEMNKTDAVDTETYYDGTSDEEYKDDDLFLDDEGEEQADNPDETADDGEGDSDDNNEDEDPETTDKNDDDGDDTATVTEDAEDGKPDGADDVKSDSELEKAAKRLLKELGIESEDPIKGLKSIIAESKGMSLEELERAEAETNAFEAQMQRDIDEIHKAYPITAKYKSLADLPKVGQFAALMDDKRLGLSAAQAFAATHPEIVEAQKHADTRKHDLRDTKTHLTSNVPKGAKDNSTTISKSEMDAYKEMFSDLTKAEIIKLHKKVNK